MPMPYPPALEAFDRAVSSLCTLEAEHKDFSVNGSIRCSREDIGLPYMVFYEIFYPIMKELWRQQERWNEIVIAKENGGNPDTSEFKPAAPGPSVGMPMMPNLLGMMGMGMGMGMPMMPGATAPDGFGPFSPGSFNPTMPRPGVDPSRLPKLTDTDIDIDIDKTIKERLANVGPTWMKADADTARTIQLYAVVDHNGSLLIDTIRRSADAAMNVLRDKFHDPSPEKLATYTVKSVQLSYE